MSTPFSNFFEVFSKIFSLPQRRVNGVREGIFAYLCVLLCLEGRAIGAGNLGGVLLVSYYSDRIQSAVILILAVMLTLLDGAFNAGVRGVLLFSSIGVFHFFRLLFRELY